MYIMLEFPLSTIYMPRFGARTVQSTHATTNKNRML